MVDLCSGDGCGDSVGVGGVGGIFGADESVVAEERAVELWRGSGFFLCDKLTIGMKNDMQSKAGAKAAATAKARAKARANTFPAPRNCAGRSRRSHHSYVSKYARPMSDIANHSPQSPGELLRVGSCRFTRIRPFPYQHVIQQRAQRHLLQHLGQRILLHRPLRNR